MKVLLFPVRSHVIEIAGQGRTRTEGRFRDPGISRREQQWRHDPLFGLTSTGP